MSRYIVAITGASGVIYGVSLVRTLLEKGAEIHLVVSDPACLVMQQELGWNLDAPSQISLRHYFPEDNLFIYNNADIAAGIASGSFLTDGMIIIPCTMSTLASVATGLSRNLIERAADVMLKERRPLVIVPRETPLNSIHLRNMLSLSDMGVAVVPAMPAFYHDPKSVEEMVAFVVGKVLDVMQIPHDEFRRYK